MDSDGNKRGVLLRVHCAYTHGGGGIQPLQLDSDTQRNSVHMVHH
jgi:hypothetical protein